MGKYFRLKTLCYSEMNENCCTFQALVGYLYLMASLGNITDLIQYYCNDVRFSGKCRLVSSITCYAMSIFLREKFVSGFTQEFLF